MGEYEPARLPVLPAANPKGDEFLKKVAAMCREWIDPDEIDRTGEIPDKVLKKLAELGAFGIKIPTEYGGLGLTQTDYCRAGMLLGSYCGNITALISAHQSIGVPQPLIVFGTEEQKKKYLPRVAAGEISAFALTEASVGSDPARMNTHAEPTADGTAFVLNGEKLWCTNGTRAGVLVVMARTPAKDGKNQITAFIVETNWPGVTVAHRCRFMGLKALYNGVIRFTDVRVPRENILLAEGKGLRVALTTLDTGRLTLPAACVGLAKRCLEISRSWASERVQWGQPIGKHAAIGDKLARMAANTFAMEAMTFYAAAIVDAGKHADIRVEAAMCKMWATERVWEIVDDTIQIRGGRGYETAQSLAARGEKPIPVERFMRDTRINTILEGSSEIIRLFIAREALDPHLKVAGPILNPKLAMGERMRALGRSAGFYALWYPRQWWPVGSYESRAARRLARAIFHAMVRYGPKLERRQLLLARFVEIGTELYAMTAARRRAEAFSTTEAWALANYFCQLAQKKIEDRFDAMSWNTDAEGYRLAQQLLEGGSGWLTEGIV